MWRVDKREERGRTVDVHALRHTFGTLMSKGGVAPRTAQAAMWHSKIDLTMSGYTDPKLLDVRRARVAATSGGQSAFRMGTVVGVSSKPSHSTVPQIPPASDSSVEGTSGTSM